MQIRVGYDLAFDCTQPVPFIVTLNVHYSRTADLIHPDYLRTEPSVPQRAYRDTFGNWCTRLVAPTGHIRLTADALVRDSGVPEPVFPNAMQHAIQDLPDEALLFLLGSRYCETDRLTQTAWSMFGHVEGWARVQAICDFVHRHVTFDYQHARPTRTAWETYNERIGVCRDFAHLAMTLCRCTNIPARYCTGYLGDIGVPVDPNRWISPAGSKPIWAVSGMSSTPPQRAPDRTHPDCRWPRCRRCRHHQHIRTEYAGRVPGVDR